MMLQVVLVRHRAKEGLAWECFLEFYHYFSFMDIVNNFLLIYDLGLIVELLCVLSRGDN